MSLRRTRSRNTARPPDLQELLDQLYPGNADQLQPGCDLSVEAWLERHVEFTVRLLSVTPRPTIKLIKEALDYKYPDIPRGRAASFADMCCSAVSMARDAKKSIKDGSTIHPALYRVARALDTSADLESPKPAQKTRALMKNDSVVSVASSEPEPLEDDRYDAIVKSYTDMSVCFIIAGRACRTH